MTRSRNFTDQVGYGSTPADERYGFLAGLIGGMVVVLGAVIGGMLS